MKKTHIEVAEVKSESKLRRNLSVYIDGGERHEIYHESAFFRSLNAQTPLDGQVLSVLLFAMLQGLPLHVHGALSTQMLRNLEELQNIWVSWKPEIYRKIDIVSDRIVDKKTLSDSPRAISAFSGGVDATFTAIAHKQYLPETTRYPLTDVVMVHGFDVRLDNQVGFDALQSRVKPFLDDIGLSMHTVKTNSKFINIQNWEDSFALELAAVLHQFSDQFDYGLIGRSEPYHALIYPWGSTPISDHHMGGDVMKIVHDGAGYSRTEKIKVVAGYPVATKCLRVCWQGADQSKNCGVCEKCIRTKMNFLATGLPVPECFDSGLDLGSIRDVSIHNYAQKNEFDDLLAYAKRNRISDPWVTALTARLDRRMPWQKNPLRQFAISFLDKLGLKDSLKRLLSRA